MIILLLLIIIIILVAIWNHVSNGKVFDTIIYIILLPIFYIILSPFIFLDNQKKRRSILYLSQDDLELIKDDYKITKDNRLDVCTQVTKYKDIKSGKTSGTCLFDAETNISLYAIKPEKMSILRDNYLISTKK